MMVQRNDEVVLLFGGPGEERLVSIASAMNLVSVLPEALLWFQDRARRVYQVEKSALLNHSRPFENEFEPRGTPLFSSLEEAFDSPRYRSNVFFLGFHGGDGEDGTVQKMLEDRGLAFTGSGSKASSIAFDKRKTKLAAQARGVRVAEECTFEGSDQAEIARRLVELVRRSGGAVVKPVASGSSVGLSKITNEKEAIAVAGRISAVNPADYFAEAMLIGPELTVGVIERAGKLQPLPPSEVIVEAGASFDYAGKYLGKAVEVTPAEKPAEVIAAAQALARTVHETLGCRGYSRTDVIITSDGATLLEINTLPGLTKASFIPQQLAAAGIPLPQFIEEQIAIGRERAARSI